jgi:hypothetical protein
VQLAGQTCAAWFWRSAGGRKIQRFYSTKIMNFINLKYDAQPMPDDAMCWISPTNAPADVNRVAWEGAQCGALRPNKSRGAAPLKCGYSQRTGKIDKTSSAAIV